MAWENVPILVFGFLICREENPSIMNEGYEWVSQGEIYHPSWSSFQSSFIYQLLRYQLSITFHENDLPHSTGHACINGRYTAGIAQHINSHLRTYFLLTLARCVLSCFHHFSSSNPTSWKLETHLLSFPSCPSPCTMRNYSQPQWLVLAFGMVE